MNRQTSRMIPPIGRPQIFGIAAVLAAFLLVEFVVGDQTTASVVLSVEAQTTTR
jgi:hypothetical protein